MPLFLQPFAKYADFNGRARRAEFWQWFAFQFVVGFVFGILKSIVGVGTITMLQVIFALATLVPSIAVAVRRFHDTNRTGWWYLFAPVVAGISTMLYIPFAGAGYLDAMKAVQNGGAMDPATALAIVGGMAWVILAYLAAALVTFIFHVLPGTEGANRFGPDPKGNGTDVARIFDAPERDQNRDTERATRGTYDDDDKPYKPVFDFGPTARTPVMAELPVVDAMMAPAQARPAMQSAAPAKPVFGKRR